MRPRVVLEVLVVIGVVGLSLEVAEGHLWVVISAGIATTIWLLPRTH